MYQATAAITSMQGARQTRKRGCYMDLQEKLEALRAYIKELGCAAVSFSGGVDSTFLLAVAHEVLGKRVIAITESNPLYPARETSGAVDFCKQRGIRQYVVEHDVDSWEALKTNPQNRCYLCKVNLFTILRQIADEHACELGLIKQGERIAYLEGSNASDLLDYRPGHKAVKELGALSPLEVADLTKDEIRALSRKMGLPTADKPSFACLATRFPYGQAITANLLKRLDAAEQLLIDAKLGQMRVRMHEGGTLARVEVTSDRIDDLLAFMRDGGSEKFHELGFDHVSIDVDGYRTGSMNTHLEH